MKAPLIIICGIDGSGKTSVVNAVNKKYPTVHVTREPGGTYMAEKIRSLLLSEKGATLSAEEQMDLFFAARQIHLLELIEPKRIAGIPVISDRFDASTFAYQKCLQIIDGKQVLNDSLCSRFFEEREHVINGCDPSLYVYLQVDPHEGMRRRALARDQDINHFDLGKIEEQIRRDASYIWFFNHIHAVQTSKVAVVDANQNQGKVIHDALKVVNEEIKLFV